MWRVVQVRDRLPEASDTKTRNKLTQLLQYASRGLQVSQRSVLPRCRTYLQCVASLLSHLALCSGSDAMVEPRVGRDASLMVFMPYPTVISVRP